MAKLTLAQWCILVDLSEVPFASAHKLGSRFVSMKRLREKGLVELAGQALGSRASHWPYRITDAGRAALTKDT